MKANKLNERQINTKGAKLRLKIIKCGIKINSDLREINANAQKTEHTSKPTSQT